MAFETNTHLPLLTVSLPGIGGKIKEAPEDFEVEEIPAYEPSGNGEFLYLWVEKRAMGAEFFIRTVAERLDLARSEIGSAGLKDRHAVTRQMISVPTCAEGRLTQLDGDGIRLLSANRHGNKLRPGHLRGNRFRVLIRHVVHGASAFLEPILAVIQHQGLPNFYGAQRFGRAGETLQLGRNLLRNGRGSGPRNPFLRKLALSAVQSSLFNHYLTLRLKDGLLRRVLAGDVMAKRPFGGMFTVTDVDREQSRFDARETVHTGPVFGRKMFPATTAAAEREAAVLAAAELKSDAFSGFGKLLLGTRRPNVVYPENLTSETIAEGIRLCFTLPAGSYATVFLAEVMKADMPLAETESD